MARSYHRPHVFSSPHLSLIRAKPSHWKKSDLAVVSLTTAGELNKMGPISPFQLKGFYDSLKVFWGGGVFAFGMHADLVWLQLCRGGWQLIPHITSCVTLPYKAKRSLWQASHPMPCFAGWDQLHCTGSQQCPWWDCCSSSLTLTFWDNVLLPNHLIKHFPLKTITQRLSHRIFKASV